MTASNTQPEPIAASAAQAQQQRSGTEEMTTIRTNKIEFKAGWQEMPHAILDFRKIGDRVLVIYDYMEFPRLRQAHNLVAYDLDGKALWTAEHPTSETADCYVNFMSDAPLWIGNFAGFKCQFDLKTGKLTQTVFTK